MRTMSHELKLGISYRQILQMSLPISFAILVPQFNYLINSFFLSQLGPGYIGAAGLTGVYYLIFTAVGFGLNNGLQGLISRRGVQERENEIGTLFMQSVYVSLAIAAAGIILTFTAAPIIFKKYTDPLLFDQSMGFLSIRIWGLPFLYLYQMRNALLVGTNQSKLLIWGTLAETLSNILLDYVLIFGHWGFPALGFNGAAYASVVAECIGMIVVFVIINAKNMGERFGLFKSFRFNPSITKTILIQSSPLILQYGISIVSWEFFFVLVSHDGRMALDISQIMRLMFGFFGIFIWAFAATSNTMVSNIIGQGMNKRVLILIRRIATLSLGFTILIFIPLQIFPEALLNFLNLDPAYIPMAVPVFRVVTFAILIMSVSTVCLNAVTGTGNTRINLMIEAFTICIYCFYIYYVLEVKNLSIAWGWGSELLYWSSILILSLGYLLSGKWNNLKSRNI